MGQDEDDALSDEESFTNKIDKLEDYVEKFYCEAAERLTKVCVIAESDECNNAESIKTLAKHMYKFEVTLERLLKIIKSGKSKSFSDGTLPMGFVKWVNESKDPVEWIKLAAVDRRNYECNKLKAASQAIELFKTSLLDTLQQEQFIHNL